MRYHGHGRQLWPRVRQALEGLEWRRHRSEGRGEPAVRERGLLPDRPRGLTTTILVTRQRGEHVPQLISRDVSGARGLLVRKDLLQLLDRAVTKRVTVISAPPGSGKTSLLRAWADRSTNLRRVAFVTVERDQQNEQRFWCAVLDAIRSPARSIDSETPPAPNAALDVDQVIDSVLSEVAEQVEPLELIIDDLHELKSAVALTQLENLLPILPSSARVVLSSRRDPSIRLHQLRLADDIAEIRAGDLRFTERETGELLAGSAISLSAAGVAALHQRTEGWAAGLRLAVISLSGHPDPERFVAEFSGTDRAIGEYLIAEMLERHPSEVQSMLLRTSLVDRMNGELADLLAGRSGSERMLLELEDANAFVVSLDAQRTWFRYHQLLADFLRLELRRTLADEVPDLHRRAARWFADRGDVVEAVRHTVAAGDWPDAARLVADHSFRWVLDGQAGKIRAVLQAFPEGASVDHPDLALAHAAAELNQGRMEEAAAQLALAESHVQSAPPTRRRRLAVAIASLRLALARRSGQFSEVIEQVKLLDASVADASSEAMGSELRGVALLNLGIVETWSGRLADAERHLSEGAALAQTIGRPYLEVACRAHQGFPSKLVSVATARERGRQAVALAERYGLDDRPILAPALGAVGGMAIWMGEFDEGERWLRRAWEVGSAHVDPAAAVLFHLATGMLHAGRGKQQSALEAFTAAAQAQSLLTGVHALAPRITGWLATTQARLGRQDEARATLAGFSAEPERMGAISNARAWICMADGDSGTALEVLREVRDIAPPVEPFTLVEAHLLAGTAHLRLGDRNAAAAAAEAALATAEPDRLIFPFAMTEAAELLDVLLHHETAHRALLADIVDLLRGASAPSTDREPLSQSDELSPSELRVLGYLPTNLTRPEIAQELHVSINTVNTHIRNVYAKLGARDRSAAVQRARQLRLLSNRLSPTSAK
ncbi:MAG: LuxR family transcriptional regulator, maltose regulon positive regulatory protein [Pseudonocardiales bacterium]|nr:LuxR family transcriptional regulator, maltose regulon positive regulatory protein [Pseudonocardiales bacterium]